MPYRLPVDPLAFNPKFIGLCRFALHTANEKVIYPGMKRQTLFTLFALICAASIIAQGVSYTPVEAAKHVGETTRITGTVDGVHQSGKGNIFLNMGGMYLSLHGFIPSASAAQFPNPRQYEGKTMSVSGKITFYKGKPEIIVNSPSQISAK